MGETQQISSTQRADARESDLDVAVLLARRASGTSRASLMLPSAQRGELHIVASSGIPPGVVARTRVRLGDGVAGTVAETGHPVLANAQRPHERGVGYRTSSFISVPVPHGDAAFGVLSVADPLADGELGPADLVLMEHIAQDIARVLEQGTHRGRVRHFQRLMRQVHHHATTIRDEERVRIARELHDNLGSNLTAALFAIDIVLAQLPAEDRAPRRTLQRARTHVHGGIGAMHDAVFALHPTILRQEGLANALRALTEDLTEGGVCQVRLDIDDRGLPGPSGEILADPSVVRSLDPALQLTLYRTVQEALTNIRKHAKATEVAIRLTLHRRLAVLRIEDNGIGVGEVMTAGGTPTGLGLRGLRERAGALGGRLEIASRKGGGTTLSVRLPLPTSGHGRPT